jgi:lipoprotein-anchoring transpeptidase ErfK/SrfK
MRKTFLLAFGLAAMSVAGMVSADAAVKTYWDQATGKWMKYDTKARKAAPLSSNTGNTTQMGKPQQTYRNSNPVPRQTVDYSGPFKPNTIVVNTAERRLYYVMPNGKALRYGVGVGRDGFTWSGVDTISRKAEWPGWTPPPEMIARERKNGRILPAYMEGGINNPLGARALYIGGTLYRIHGTTEPWTIGTAVSSGCIRLTNDDVTHLYERVKVGTRVVVLRGDESRDRLAALANPPPPKKEIVVAEARNKDDALESIGVGLGIAVAGTIPVEAASPETTASVTPAPAAEAAVEEPTVADVPEAVAKDDDVAAALPEAVEDAVGADEPAVAAVSAPAIDDAAKDDATSDATVAVVEPAAVETEEETVAVAADEVVEADESVADVVEAIAEADEVVVETEAAVSESDAGETVATEVEEAVAVVEPAEVAPNEVEANEVEAVVPAEASAPSADPVAKDDGLATDLGGKAIPINASPKLPDDKAASNTRIAPATVAN